jgi:hypothetical protein
MEKKNMSYTLRTAPLWTVSRQNMLFASLDVGVFGQMDSVLRNFRCGVKTRGSAASQNRRFDK